MAVITKERWSRATPAQRYQWQMQGHVAPAEFEALQATGDSYTVDGVKLRQPTPKAPRPASAKVDAVRFVQRLEEAGMSREQIRAYLEADPEAVKAYQSAKSTNEAVQSVLQRHAYSVGQVTNQIQNEMRTLQSEYDEGRIASPEYVVKMLSLGVHVDDPALNEVVREMNDWEREEMRGLLEAEAAIANLEASNREAQARDAERAQAMQAQAAQEEAVDAILGKYAEHADNPLISEAVVGAFTNSDGVPSPEILEATIQEALILNRAMEMATEKFERDKTIRDQLVAGNAYGLDPQTGESLAPEVEMSNYVDFIQDARKEIIPEAKPSAMEVLEAGLAPAERSRAVTEEIQVAAAESRVAAEREDDGNKSSHAQEWEARQASHVRPADDVESPAKDY